jgi:hypothetical protein
MARAKRTAPSTYELTVTGAEVRVGDAIIGDHRGEMVPIRVLGTDDTVGERRYLVTDSGLRHVTVAAEYRVRRAVPIVHARILRYEGHAYSPGWTGKRQYSDRKDAKGRVLLACGALLDDVFAESRFMGFVDIKSTKSRDAQCVTCPECARVLDPYLRRAV